MDQIVEQCCGMAQRAHAKNPTKEYLWEDIRSILIYFRITS